MVKMVLSATGCGDPHSITACKAPVSFERGEPS